MHKCTLLISNLNQFYFNILLFLTYFGASAVFGTSAELNLTSSVTINMYNIVILSKLTFLDNIIYLYYLKYINIECYRSRHRLACY